MFHKLRGKAHAVAPTLETNQERRLAPDPDKLETMEAYIGKYKVRHKGSNRLNSKRYARPAEALEARGKRPES